MKPPIHIDEHGDVTSFATIEEAERFMEPVDVRNGEYVVTDSEGKRLEIEIVTKRVPCMWWGLWTVSVERVWIARSI